MADIDDSLPPALSEGTPLPEVLERHFARVRAWQKTPEGAAARARWEREKIARARAEREELAAIRGIPGDLEVRRWALEAHPSGPLFTAVREAIDWRRDRSAAEGGDVAAIRVLIGPPGTGKTSALAWAAATWERRALYRTADAIARSKDESAFEDAARVSLLVLDELGIEAYPDRVTELLLARWTRGGLTLCASNLSFPEFEARYLTGAGQRLADRLRQQKRWGLRTFVKANWSSYRGLEGEL